MGHFVLCEIDEPGLIAGERTVAVRDYQGRLEYLRAADDGVVRRDGRVYVGVGVVRFHEPSDAYLVTLPAEADSGAHRVWVRKADVIEAESGVAGASR